MMIDCVRPGDKLSTAIVQVGGLCAQGTRPVIKTLLLYAASVRPRAFWAQLIPHGLGKPYLLNLVVLPLHRAY